MRAVRRLGRPAGARTGGQTGSPDVLELDNGDFAVVGWDITEVIDTSSLPGVHWVPGERVVRVDRSIFIDAHRDMPGDQR